MFHALTVVLVIACGAVLMNEGLFSAAIILASVVLAGIIAFNVFEPMAGVIERTVRFLDGYGDIIAMLGIFAVSLTIMRLITEQLAPSMPEMPDILHRGGGLIVGAATGWILSGIIICALQTLPWSQDFWGYKYRDIEKGNGFNTDRLWLAYVHRASGTFLSRDPVNQFDPRAQFIVNYNDYRRVDASGKTKDSAGAAAVDIPRGPVRSPGGPRRM